MERKLRVALLFGGRSAEHDVSLMSAANVFLALDPARYEVVPIAVARSGAWIRVIWSRGASPPSASGTGEAVARSRSCPGAGEPARPGI